MGIVKVIKTKKVNHRDFEFKLHLETILVRYHLTIDQLGAIILIIT